MADLVEQFEKLYTGNSADNESIYKELARKYNMEWEDVADYICIHRYDDVEPCDIYDPDFNPDETDEDW